MEVRLDNALRIINNDRARRADLDELRNVLENMIYQAGDLAGGRFRTELINLRDHLRVEKDQEVDIPNPFYQHKSDVISIRGEIFGSIETCTNLEIKKLEDMLNEMKEYTTKETKIISQNAQLTVTQAKEEIRKKFDRIRELLKFVNYKTGY